MKRNRRTGTVAKPLDTPKHQYQCEKNPDHPPIVTNVATPRCGNCKTGRMTYLGPAPPAMKVTANITNADKGKIRLLLGDKDKDRDEELIAVEEIVADASKRGLIKELDKIGDKLNYMKPEKNHE